MFPPLPPSPPDSYPAVECHTLHPYGRLVQPCLAWSTTPFLQKNRELNLKVTLLPGSIYFSTLNANYHWSSAFACAPRGDSLFCAFLPADSLFLVFHSSLLLNFSMWSSQVFISSDPPSLFLSLSFLSEAKTTPSHSCSGMGEFVRPLLLLYYVTLICPPSVLKQRS